MYPFGLAHERGLTMSHSSGGSRRVTALLPGATGVIERRIRRIIAERVGKCAAVDRPSGISFGVLLSGDSA